MFSSYNAAVFTNKMLISCCCFFNCYISFATSFNMCYKIGWSILFFLIVWGSMFNMLNLFTTGTWTRVEVPKFKFSPKACYESIKSKQPVQSMLKDPADIGFLKTTTDLIIILFLSNTGEVHSLDLRGSKCPEALMNPSMHAVQGSMSRSGPLHWLYGWIWGYSVQFTPYCCKALFITEIGRWEKVSENCFYFNYLHSEQRLP